MGQIKNIKLHIVTDIKLPSTYNTLSHLNNNNIITMVTANVAQLEEENKAMRQTVEELMKQVSLLAKRVVKLEGGKAGVPVEETPKVEEKEEDDEETEEEKRIKEERLAAYHAKKSKKPALIAKSSLVLDVKPWDDETDMPKMEECVRSIQCDGLVWGQSKFVPLAYGIKKLQICAVIEDDKVMTD